MFAAAAHHLQLPFAAVDPLALLALLVGRNLAENPGAQSPLRMKEPELGGKVGFPCRKIRIGAQDNPGAKLLLCE